MNLNSLKKALKLKRNILIIRFSRYFDAKWYLKKYPDIAACGMDPARHYLLHGGFEGRNPSARFYSDEYLAMYNDVRAMKMNPLLHYELHGRKEGRPISTRKTMLSLMPWATIRQRMRQTVNERIIQRSKFFDARWYLQNNPDVAESGMSPARHYLLHGVKSRRNPSPFFVNDEYLALHNDVRASGMNPLLHYECYGKREGRPILFTELKEPVFPEGCVEGTWNFEKEIKFAAPDEEPLASRRVAVVASYFGSGEVPPQLEYLLRGLRQVAKRIVYVADCPVKPDEAGKLASLVDIAVFTRHKQYDFGSYRRGLEIARERGYLEAGAADELILINDSNYGPVFPFAESFGLFAEKDCDFWGYTGYNAFGNIHISSYFYVFRRKVIESKLVDEFLSGVQGEVERDKVIVKFEFRLTQFLTDHGFTWDTLVPMGFKKGAPTKYPLSILTKYRMPLLKAKAVNGDSYENTEKALEFVKEVNPELAALIVPRPIKSEHKLITYEEHQASFPSKCARVAAKLRAGEKVKAVFFVSNAAMFPARPLFEEMLSRASFDPAVIVIPDLRWHDADPTPAMEECFRALESIIPPGRLSTVAPDEFGSWPDVLAGADIVCYPSPYELSYFRYNPRNAVARDFLPITVNYGFYRSIYDRIIMSGQSYAYMWKAFFECPDTLEEYKRFSALKGANADLCGYIKMDSLAKALERAATKPRMRKKVLVALHHSVEGGTNKSLSLANFVRYADFFKALPAMFPEVDFIYRPHPFLFKVMAREDQWGPQAVEDYIAALKALPNVIWSDGGDYFDEFAGSDACVQDCGSYLVEYFYTLKPCCYMLKTPEDIERKFAPLGRKCLDACYIAYDTEAIERFIRETVIGGDDPKKSARESLAGEIMVNYPSAAKAALDHICADLEAAAQAAQIADSAAQAAS